MGKALVIKGANFSINKLKTITLNEDIPCTGISLSENAVTLSDYDPYTLVATATPNDTTDTIAWSSSDESIVTVNDGVITAVGIGTATITATCGSQSAQATITVSVSVNVFDAIFGNLNYISNHAYYTASTNRVLICGDGTFAAEHYIPLDNDDSKRVYPIKIPKHTKKVIISRVGDYSLFYNASTNVRWLQDIACGDSGNENAAKYIGQSSESMNFRNDTSGEFAVPENANLISFPVRTSSSYSDSDDPITVAESFGITISFSDSDQ